MSAKPLKTAATYDDLRKVPDKYIEADRIGGGGSGRQDFGSRAHGGQRSSADLYVGCTASRAVVGKIARPASLACKGAFRLHGLRRSADDGQRRAR